MWCFISVCWNMEAAKTHNSNMNCFLSVIIINKKQYDLNQKRSEQQLLDPPGAPSQGHAWHGHVSSWWELDNVEPRFRKK